MFADRYLAEMKFKMRAKAKKMRSINNLIRRSFAPTTFFSFQKTIYNPGCSFSGRISDGCV
jgi:hypothetical protein